MMSAILTLHYFNGATYRLRCFMKSFAFITLLAATMPLTACQSFQFVESPIPVKNVPVKNIPVKTVPAKAVIVDSISATTAPASDTTAPTKTISTQSIFDKVSVQNNAP